MFRTCPSSGGKIVFTEHLVSSLSVNVCTVHWLRADSIHYVLITDVAAWWWRSTPGTCSSELISRTFVWNVQVVALIKWIFVSAHQSHTNSTSPHSAPRTYWHVTYRVPNTVPYIRSGFLVTLLRTSMWKRVSPNDFSANAKYMQRHIFKTLHKA